MIIEKPILSFPEGREKEEIEAEKPILPRGKGNGED
jgi:hypothetical protein